MTASGTVTRMTNGCTKLSNCAASTRKTIKSAKPNMKARLPLDSRYSSDSPW